MASLLGNLDEVYQIYNEIDHIVSFAGMLWEQRSGCSNCLNRDPLLQPRTISIIIGQETRIMHGPSEASIQEGGCIAPPLERRPRTAYRAGRRSVGGNVQEFKVPSSVPVAGRPKSSQASFSAHQACYQEIPVPDFVLLESPFLAQLFAQSGGNPVLGPLNRNPHLFLQAVALMKLRWLLRLHLALVSLGGRRCSLEHLFAGMLSDTCRAHKYKHSPLQVVTLITETLHTRLRANWPVFLAYVGTFHPDLQLGGSQMDFGGESTTGVLPTGQTPRNYDISGSGLHQSSDGIGAGAPRSIAELSRILDDIWVSWLAQQPAELFPAAQVFQELDFYQMAPPDLEKNVDGIRDWMMLKDKSGPRQIKRAQLHAHRLALFLELPESSWKALRISLDDILDMAQTIVGHPNTFSRFICKRVAFNLEGCGYFQKGHGASPDPDDAADQTVLGTYSLAACVDHDQMGVFRSRNMHPRDAGTLTNAFLETNRDKGPPWLVGQEAIFPSHTDRWISSRSSTPKREQQQHLRLPRCGWKP
jgi:hypothetical protein